MNAKRWMVLIFYAAYLLLLVGLGFIYQVTRRHNPPQSLLVSLENAFANVLVAQYSTLFGILMIVGFTLWFVAYSDRGQRR